MANILITGTTRGIGLGLVRTFLDQGLTVYAATRSEAHADALVALGATHGDRLRPVFGDLDDEQAPQRLLAALGDEALDYALFNAGIYGPSHQDPAQIDTRATGALFTTNAITPLRLAQHLAPRVVDGGVLGFTSSQMGSLALNRAAEMPLYGASKAALNSLLRSWAERSAPLRHSILALHPGWVQTDMGGGQAPLTVEDSTQGLARVIQAHRGHALCAFLDYQGETLPW
ncbi:SDR family oxidoreductase [Pseudomonas mangiferae]|uniref:SDR family oxidoreductase n=1 Tax=Pseudomonas mangiferae TaxID=2593654 RepID=A0A553H4I5_9PSED|nr:SDR family oxidoreductase [Pseudomonas mangiferae]TRX76680.1 SDR family oxidoreductase [Pseudomonas mangiferae]